MYLILLVFLHILEIVRLKVLICCLLWTRSCTFKLYKSSNFIVELRDCHNLKKDLVPLSHGTISEHLGLLWSWVSGAWQSSCLCVPGDLRKEIASNSWKL